VDNVIFGSQSARCGGGLRRFRGLSEPALAYLSGNFAAYAQPALLAQRPVELRRDLQRAFPLRAHRNLQEQIARIDIAVIVRQQIARHRGNLPGDSSRLC
jgi:hypothetical protein